MTHRHNLIAFILCMAFLTACGQKEYSSSKETNDTARKIMKTDEEWRKQLTGEQYRITRKKGTEPAFTGVYYEHKGDGKYLCICCGNVLFDSATKYESGSGWPSFYAPESKDAIGEEDDSALGMKRTEIVCSRCNAHLGHVFDDGPQPTGLRYCVNSASLKFVEREKTGK